MYSTERRFIKRDRCLGARYAALFVIFVAVLLLARVGLAQSNYKTLHKFGGTNDGQQPVAGVIFDPAGNLYGTTVEGGASGNGAVFRLTPDSNGSWTESVLYSFTGAQDGRVPFDVIFDSNGNLYGTTAAGGNNGAGVVYELKPSRDGWTLNVLHTFAGGHDGASPAAGLTFDSSGNLYGTTLSGGVYSSGTVFKLTPESDGTWKENVLYDFTGGDNGANPYAPVILDANGSLYGTTAIGGRDNVGVVFKLRPAKGVWTISVIHSFTGGRDGGSPFYGRLVMDTAGNLYGTTSAGGVYEYGTAFRLTQSTGKWVETVMHSFANRDGAVPYGGLTFDLAGNLFGTTLQGGDLSLCAGYGCGVVFKLTPNSNGGWNETVLHDFVNNPGANPYAGVIFDAAGSLYGTTRGSAVFGGATNGSVFEVMP